MIFLEEYMNYTVKMIFFSINKIAIALQEDVLWGFCTSTKGSDVIFFSGLNVSLTVADIHMFMRQMALTHPALHFFFCLETYCQHV